MTLKINIMLVSILVAIILVLAGITYTYTRTISRHTVESHQQGLAQEAAKMTQMWLDHRFKLIDALARTLEDLYLTRGQDPRPILKMTMAAGDFSDVYLGLFNGTMIDGADWRAPKDYDPRTRPWYTRAMEEKKLALTRPFLDQGFWKMVIAVVVPLVHNNQVVGVLSANIILDTLQASVMDLRIGRYGYAFIIDSQGTVLVHQNKSLMMTTKIQESDPGLSKFGTYFPGRDVGSFSYRDRILSFHKLNDSGWYLCTNVDQEEALALAKNTGMLFAMAMVLKILGILALLLFLAVGGFALILFISKNRFEAIVSGKDKDLRGEIIRRKELETRYHTLFNMATNAIMLTKNGTYIECNQKALNMFGLAQDQIIGKTMLDLSPDTQMDGTATKLKLTQVEQPNASGGSDVFKWTFKRADGSEFPAEIGISTLKLDQEMVNVYSVWDISKRVNAEQNLRQAQKMAAMGEMLSAIAHQWRQPLNALSSYIASLTPAFYNQMISSTFIEKLVREADTQIQFMSRTINDFREYFRPSKNKHTFEMMDAIQSAIKLVKPQLRQHHITLDLDQADPGAPMPILGYKNEFVHVLVNVLSNAKDAINERQAGSPKRSVHKLINLSVVRHSDQVCLEIQDTGCGIPPHLLDKIFTPYFTTKGTATGTGIGLYMAKMIVEKEMKGIIQVENRYTGAMFRICLPLSPEENPLKDKRES
ncbi:cache domain-containing protein [uncultured Desulfobacter sp.]|uniref:cache domain-containing protein n=1 Tax=uncultured Desulfobacter sp. TaxID=240139 RepID=UPI002AAC1363|nr:cache domain-containing protein [uncultured Desulfobacter sp.]